MKKELYKIGDRVRVYGYGLNETLCRPSRAKGTIQQVDPSTNIFLHYQVELDEFGGLGWFDEKQVKKLKPKLLKLGTKVLVSPSWSKWFLKHLDVYYVPGHPNEFKEEDYKEIRARLSQVIDNIYPPGEIIGYGMDKSYRVAFELDGVPFSTYIGREDLVI